MNAREAAKRVKQSDYEWKLVMDYIMDESYRGRSWCDSYDINRALSDRTVTRLKELGYKVTVSYTEYTGILWWRKPRCHTYRIEWRTA